MPMNYKYYKYESPPSPRHVTRASVVALAAFSLSDSTHIHNGTRTVRVRRQSVSFVQFRPSRGTPARRSPTARLYRAGLNTIDDNEHATVPVGQPNWDNRRTQTHDWDRALDGNHARRATRTDFHFIYTTAQEKIRNHAHAHEMSELTSTTHRLVC